MGGIQKKIDRLGQAIGKLEDEAHAAGAETRAQMEKLKPELERKLAEVRAKLVALKSRGGEAWQEAGKGTKKALQDIEEAYEEAVRRLKEKPPTPGADRGGSDCAPPG